MRMKIGYIQKAHPAISAEAAFCAIAETAGDIDYAIELIGTDPCLPMICTIFVKT